MHWASYQGHYKVVWILLKEGLSPLEIDMYGNTAIHQAAAAGNLNVLECFLARGIDVNIPNARGHSPMDMATEPETKKLISKATKTLKCQNCDSKFDFKNIRYYCRQSNKFYCKNCSITQWVFEDWDSKEMERPVCRSLTINQKILDHEKDLQSALELNDFKNLDISLKSCAGIDIAVKLRRKAEILHQKLEHELKIRTFLTEKHHHDNYKDIRKDVKLVNDMVTTANELEIDLDPNLVKEVNDFTARLISERNVRK